MNLSAGEIETIVRVVLERLRGDDARVKVPKESPGSGSDPRNGNDRTLKHLFANSGDRVDRRVVSDTTQCSTQLAAHDLVLDERLVTLEHLRGKLDGIQVLRVPVRSIVTPAVVDELRDRKITLKKDLTAIQRGSDFTSSESSIGDRRLLVVACPKWKSELSPLGEFTPISNNGSADVCRIAGHLSSLGKAVLWSTDTPFAASRAAAGNSILQAVQLSRLEDLDRAIREADPNVIVVDSTIWSIADTRSLAEQWVGRLQ